MLKAPVNCLVVVLLQLLTSFVYAKSDRVEGFGDGSVELFFAANHRTASDTYLVGQSSLPTVVQVADLVSQRSAIATHAASTPDSKVGEAEKSRLAKKVFRDCNECPEMVVVPAGKFTMGVPSSPRERSLFQGPRRHVHAPAFALGKTEVTVGDFKRFVRATGYITDAEKSSGEQTGCYTFDIRGGRWDWRAEHSWRNPGWRVIDTEPVVCVSWNDAQQYVAWLSTVTGRSYRLPSEAEWEYAARLGTSGGGYSAPNPAGACMHANVADETLNKALSVRNEGHDCRDGYMYVAPVGSFLANWLGLQDMIGNAAEWTQDCWNSSYEGAPKNSQAWLSGNCTLRTIRGGSWHDGPRGARADVRDMDTVSARTTALGFRIARGLG